MLTWKRLWLLLKKKLKNLKKRKTMKVNWKRSQRRRKLMMKNKKVTLMKSRMLTTSVKISSTPSLMAKFP